MSDDAPTRAASGQRGTLFSVLVLAVVAAVTAGAVVVVRDPGSPASAPATALQVGLSAPGLAIEGDRVPVVVTATGPDPVETVELWVGSTVVDSVVLDGPDATVSLTLHWPAAEPGLTTARARASDASGRMGVSNTVDVRVAAGPSLHIVEEPSGEDLGEIIREAGIGQEHSAAVNPGADPNETLQPGSLVLLPPRVLDGPLQPGARGESVSIEDAILHIGDPVDGIFLYLAFAGQALRIPGDPGEIIAGDADGIDLAPYLPPLPTGEVAVEVWGRSDGVVELLAALVVPASSLQAAATDLVAIRELTALGVSIPVTSLTATDAESVEMEWSSNVENEGVRWFLSTRKPDPASALTPTKVVQSGALDRDTRRFAIDLSAATPPTIRPAPIGAFPLAPIPSEVGDVTTEAGPAGRLVPINLPGATWAWVVPVDDAGDPVGPASNPVRIVVTEAPFDPTVAPPFDVVSIDVALPPAPNPALGDCIRIVSQTPPFPAGIGLGVYLNPDGSTSPKAIGGAKITGTLPYTFDQFGKALYPFTACPGERGNFQWGSVGCGADPFCHVSKGLTDLGEVAREFGAFLVGLANELADAYNELKAWVIDQVASTICPSAVAGACKTLIEVAVDALLTSVGVPPTMPNFDDLADVAKGELVDLAMDQLGVGSACDAIAQAGTGKSCGDLATELQNLDACSFAPKGQEDNCRELVAQAAEVCEFATESGQCELLTTNAQELIEQGVEGIVEESVEAIRQRVSVAALQSVGFPGPTGWFSNPDHACRWGGPDSAQVVCPPWSPSSSVFPFSSGDDPPEGCRIGTFGSDDGRVVCSYPPGEIVAIPEPLGQHQPIQVSVVLRRNQNPLPEDFACGPLFAGITTITPRGAIGQPYLPATADFPSSDLFDTGLHVRSLWFADPNPHVQIPDEQKPPPSSSTVGGLVASAVEGVTDVAGALGATSEWQYLLEEGSYVGVVVYGDCIPKTHADGPFGLAGVIPPPQPRITPGSP